MKAKTKKQIKKRIHQITRKKVVKKQTAHGLFRGLFIVVATAGTASLAFAINATRPTLNIAIRGHSRPLTTSVEFKAPPSSPASAQQVGTASWYALGLLSPDSQTCASTTFPRGTYLDVTNLRNKKKVTCLVNDYGPEAWTKRVIDLSRGSFIAIESLSAGTTPVEIRVLPGPPSSFNIPTFVAAAKFSGYTLCRQQHTAEYCEANRQESKTLQ